MVGFMRIGLYLHFYGPSFQYSNLQIFQHAKFYLPKVKRKFYLLGAGSIGLSFPGKIEVLFAFKDVLDLDDQFAVLNASV